MSNNSEATPAEGAASLPPYDNQRRHCGQPWCRCTHTLGCEFGWIDANTAAVRPCPTCHPSKARHPDETRDQWLTRLRRGRKR